MLTCWCGKVFKTFQALQQHCQATRHTIAPEQGSPGPFPNPLGPQVAVDTKTDLRQHTISVQTNAKMHVCSCGREFKTNQALQAHQEATGHQPKHGGPQRQLAVSKYPDPGLDKASAGNGTTTTRIPSKAQVASLFHAIENLHCGICQRTFLSHDQFYHHFTSTPGDVHEAARADFKRAVASALNANGPEGINVLAQALGFRPCGGCLRVFFEMGAFHKHLCDNPEGKHKGLIEKFYGEVRAFAAKAAGVEEPKTEPTAPSKQGEPRAFASNAIQALPKEKQNTVQALKEDAKTPAVEDPTATPTAAHKQDNHHAAPSQPIPAKPNPFRVQQTEVEELQCPCGHSFSQLYALAFHLENNLCASGTTMSKALSKRVGQLILNTVAARRRALAGGSPDARNNDEDLIIFPDDDDEVPNMDPDVFFPDGAAFDMEPQSPLL